MPPKAKITKDMIVEAGLKIIRGEGSESLNVRRVAALLECSTQPVMYHFKTVGELKEAVYRLADELHTGYIMTPDPAAGSPMLSIGLRYIQFAAEEKELFRFLFQTDKFQNVGFDQLMQSEELSVIIEPLCAATGLTEQQAREVFSTLFISVHGAASLIANNSVSFDREYFERMLTTIFNGAVSAAREERS